MSNPKVDLHIANQGVITLELDAAKAPKTVANFLNYVNKGHYDGTVFHRVIPGFMARTHRAGVTPCLAKWLPAPTWWTRSRPSKPATKAATRMCRWKT